MKKLIFLIVFLFSFSVLAKKTAHQHKFYWAIYVKVNNNSLLLDEDVVFKLKNWSCMGTVDEDIDSESGHVVCSNDENRYVGLFVNCNKNVTASTDKIVLDKTISVEMQCFQRYTKQ